MAETREEEAIRFIQQQIDRLPQTITLVPTTDADVSIWYAETKIVLKKYIGKDSPIIPLLSNITTYNNNPWQYSQNLFDDKYKSERDVLFFAIKMIKEHGLNFDDEFIENFKNVPTTPATINILDIKHKKTQIGGVWVLGTVGVITVIILIYNQFNKKPPELIETKTEKTDTLKQKLKEIIAVPVKDSLSKKHIVKPEKK